MPDRTPTGDLRERLREALRQAAHWCDGRCDCEFGDHKVFVVAQVDGRITEIEGTPDALADAVLHVVEHDILAAVQRVRRMAQVWIDIRPAHPTATTDAHTLAWAGEQIAAALDQPEETR